MSNAAQVLGLSQLENHEGKTVDAALALKGKIVGLFFSASWCPPCVQFSPELNAFAGRNKEDFVVVLVSQDHSEGDFINYSSHKENFLRIPWSNVSIRNGLAQRYGIYALPTLEIIHSDGTDITSWGRAAVTRNPSGCIKSWQEKQSGASVLQLLGLSS